MNQDRIIRVGLLGAGSVGAQVARLLLEQQDTLAARVGARLELTGVAVRSLDAPRDTVIPAQLLTTDAQAVIDQSELLIEVIGGIEPAKTYITQALNAGKAVVTANKALLAAHGSELNKLASQNNAHLQFEAAVAGAIPIIGPLINSLAGDNIVRAMGIVNGSTNYILDSMDSSGATMTEAMQIASDLGYLEADPTLDVEGYDAAQKAAILARMAFHTELPADAVYREGITKIAAADVAAAKRNGQVIKLLAIVEKITDETGKQAVSARVHPVLISREHPLATVRGGKNAIFVNAESAGELMFYGAGAGGVETASAVLGDVVTVARRIVAGAPALLAQATQQLPALPLTQVRTAYQLRLLVQNQPAALAQITSIFASHGVAIVNAQQTAGAVTNGENELFVTTALATEAQLQQAVAELTDCLVTVDIASVLRCETGS